MLERVQRVSLADAVVEQLRKLVLDSDLQPGDKIPSEQQLCELMGVSRTVVREAKKALITMGLLTAHPGRGTFIRDGFLTVLSDPLTWDIPLSSEDVRELVEARLIVETASAALAARRADAQDRAKLSRLYRRAQEALAANDMDSLVQADLALHAAIAEAAHNAVVMRITLALRSVLENFIKATSTVPGTSQAMLDEHGKIVDAILRADPEGARSAMRSSLQALASRVLSTSKASATSIQSLPSSRERVIVEAGRPPRTHESYEA